MFYPSLLYDSVFPFFPHQSLPLAFTAATSPILRTQHDCIGASTPLYRRNPHVYPTYTDAAVVYPELKRGNTPRTEDSHRPWVSVHLIKEKADSGWSEGLGLTKDRDRSPYLEVRVMDYHRCFPLLESMWYWIFTWRRFGGGKEEDKEGDDGVWCPLRLVLVMQEASLTEVGEEEEKGGHYTVSYEGWEVERNTPLPCSEVLAAGHPSASRFPLTHLRIKNPLNAIDSIHLHQHWPPRALRDLVYVEFDSLFGLERGNGTTIRTVQHILQSSGRLESLLVSPVAITTEDLKLWASEPHFTGLEYLQFNVQYTDEGAMTVLYDCFREKGLQMLECVSMDECGDFVGNDYTEDHPGWAVGPLGSLPGLRKLSLNGSQFRRFGDFFAALRTPPHGPALETLLLEWTAVEDLEGLSVAQTSLRVLQINGSDRLASLPLDRGCSFVGLTELRLEHCDVLNDVTTVVSGGAPYLETLHIEQCAVEYLSRGQPSPPLSLLHLRGLAVIGCPLRRIVECRDPSQPVHLPSLETLDLTNCGSIESLELYTDRPPSLLTTVKCSGVDRPLCHDSLLSLLAHCTALRYVSLSASQLLAQRRDPSTPARADPFYLHCLLPSASTLQELYLSYNPYVSDLKIFQTTPFPRLRRLSLHGCPLVSLAPLACLPSLQQLNAGEGMHGLDDLEFCRHTTQLERIDIRNLYPPRGDGEEGEEENTTDTIISLSPLQYCASLTCVSAWRSSVGCLTGLHRCRHLTVLFLSDNPTLDTIFPVRHLTLLREFHFCDTSVELLSFVKDHTPDPAELHHLLSLTNIERELDVLATLPSLASVDIRGCYRKGWQPEDDGKRARNLTRVLQQLTTFGLRHLRTLWCVGLDDVFSSEEEESGERMRKEFNEAKEALMKKCGTVMIH